MANDPGSGQSGPGRQPWDSRVREAATHVENDLRRLVDYINDEVMPDVRRNGSSALRAAAGEFEKLARRMDESHRGAAPPPEQKP